ncbi:MAG: hypothetical protein QS98_C0007G0001 [archaeon GW2011_AR3]|nr:MAG: hypothetical protein QS98_C0007G0001 [archaeon GW2011_AR3]MBS3108912.1 hypothetical protein [Candidatus Woesearchaeota archaeon]
MKKGELDLHRVQARHKGQVSMEYLLVVGFAMLMTIPVLIVFFQQTNELGNTFAVSQARTIVDGLAQSADEVYYQGYPAQKTIKAYFPESINSITIDGHEINIEMKMGNGLSDLFAVTAANVTGNVSTVSGPKWILIKASTETVNITQVG